MQVPGDGKGERGTRLDGEQRTKVGERRSGDGAATESEEPAAKEGDVLLNLVMLCSRNSVVTLVD